MKQHIHMIMSDKEMNDIANAFIACDREITLEVENDNVVLHFEREDADEFN